MEKVIRGDLRKIKSFVQGAAYDMAHTAKGFGKGIAYGLATPFYVRDGAEHFLKNGEDPSKHFGEMIGDVLGQGFGLSGELVVISTLPPEAQAAVGATALATNTTKYLYSVHKRAKENQIK